MPSPDAVDTLGYVYFPGCALKGVGIAYEESLVTLFDLLGLPLQELADWNCCGATFSMAIDEETAVALASRNLALAQQHGAMELLAPCGACYHALQKTLARTHKYPALHRAVQEAMQRGGLPFPNAVRVRHPLEVLFTDVGEARIAHAVRRRWPGGRVACYYGCQVAGPYADVDDPCAPTRMDELLAAAGVPTVDYPLKTRCCGGSATGPMTDVGPKLTAILIDEAIRRDAEALVTICPICQFNLELDQRGFPVLLLPQVLGWVFGADREALGLHRAIAGRAVLDEWLGAENGSKDHDGC